MAVAKKEICSPDRREKGREISGSFYACEMKWPRHSGTREREESIACKIADKGSFLSWGKHAPVCKALKALVGFCETVASSFGTHYKGLK